MNVKRFVWATISVGCLLAVGCGSDGDDDPGAGDAGNDNANSTDDGNTNGNHGNGNGVTEPACGEGQTVDAGFVTVTESASCDALGAVTVPLEVTLAAAPVGAVNAGAPTDVQVQARLVLNEEVVGALGLLVSTSVISEASADVDAGTGTATVNVPADVPCSIDFLADPDGNGAPGPIVVTTPVLTQAWTEDGGSLTVQLPDVTFNIASPVPLMLSTKGDTPACLWDDVVPSLSFDVP